MHIPVARDEIAHFLEVCPSIVDQLWQTNQLHRTIGCPYRCNPALSWSSQYDVLEYALTSGDLPVILTKELAALWICNLAEADENCASKCSSQTMQVERLISMADEDGLTTSTIEAARISTTIIVARIALDCLCRETDNAAA